MSKLKLLVSAADTANNSERWYEFVVFLSRSLDQAIGLDTALDKEDFRQRMHRADLIFAAPQDAVRLCQQAGYLPLCRPVDQAEEVVFVTHRDNSNPSLKGFHNAPVITSTETVPTRLGLTLLARKAIKPASLEGKPGWMAVVKALQLNTESYGFLSKNFYDELKPLSREGMRVLATSKLNKVYNQFMLKPEHQALSDALTMTLLSMQESDKGRQVLEKLGITGWTESSGKEFEQLEQLLRMD
ncbi:MAG: PhnD/SsuA/transferrin family substrate-binding protein [Pontibacterium sp.]